MEYTPQEQLLLERIQGMDEHELATGIVPIHDVVDILGSRWKVEILTGVARGLSQGSFRQHESLTKR